MFVQPTAWLPVATLLLLTIALRSLSAAPTEAPKDETDERSYWLKRKDDFYKSTSFPLSEDNVRLIGGKFSRIRAGHLPFWFDYGLYKKVFNKTACNSPDEETKRHNVYINTCLRAIISRTMFRMLAATSDTFITKEADLFYSERNPDLKATGSKRGESGKKPAISLAVEFNIEFAPDEAAKNETETPIERAIRLMRLELDRVESRNQIETYLKAFDVSDLSEGNSRIHERKMNKFNFLAVVLALVVVSAVALVSAADDRYKNQLLDEYEEAYGLGLKKPIGAAASQPSICGRIRGDGRACQSCCARYERAGNTSSTRCTCSTNGASR